MHFAWATPTIHARYRFQQMRHTREENCVGGERRRKITLPLSSNASASRRLAPPARRRGPAPSAARAAARTPAPPRSSRATEPHGWRPSAASWPAAGDEAASLRARLTDAEAGGSAAHPRRTPPRSSLRLAPARRRRRTPCRTSRRTSSSRIEGATEGGAGRDGGAAVPRLESAPAELESTVLESSYKGCSAS